MSESQSWVKVEHWCHLLVALGATGVVASLTVDVKGIANAHALLLSLGAMFIGLGEWINHPIQTKLMLHTIYAQNGEIITGHPRNPSNLGNLFDVLGFVLLVVALHNLYSTGRPPPREGGL